MRRHAAVARVVWSIGGFARDAEIDVGISAQGYAVPCRRPKAAAPRVSVLAHARCSDGSRAGATMAAGAGPDCEQPGEGVGAVAEGPIRRRYFEEGVFAQFK